MGPWHPPEIPELNTQLNFSLFAHWPSSVYKVSQPWSSTHSSFSLPFCISLPYSFCFSNTTTHNNNKRQQKSPLYTAKRKNKVWHYGRAGKSYSLWCWYCTFKSHLLHFQSCILLIIAWEKHQGWSKCLDLCCLPERPGWNSFFCHNPVLTIATMWGVNQPMEAHSLFFRNSDFQINTNLEKNSKTQRDTHIHSTQTQRKSEYVVSSSILQRNYTPVV